MSRPGAFGKPLSSHLPEPARRPPGARIIDTSASGFPNRLLHNGGESGQSANPLTRASGGGSFLQQGGPLGIPSSVSQSWSPTTRGQGKGCSQWIFVNRSERSRLDFARTPSRAHRPRRSVVR